MLLKEKVARCKEIQIAIPFLEAEVKQVSLEGKRLLKKLPPMNSLPLEVREIIWKREYASLDGKLDIDSSLIKDLVTNRDLGWELAGKLEELGDEWAALRDDVITKYLESLGLE